MLLHNVFYNYQTQLLLTGDVALVSPDIILTGLTCEEETLYSNRFFHSHAQMRMTERNVSPAEVFEVLANGIQIEYHPTFQPHPKEIFFGFLGVRPIHVVVWNITATQTSIIYTVYEPKLDKWYPDFRTRR